MDLGLRGRTVVMTGVSKGISYITAETFLKEDAKVVICSHHEDELKGTAQAPSDLEEVYYEASDVSSATENYTFTKHIHDRSGSLDAWVNNIGTTGYKKGEEYDGEEIDFMTGIRFKSVIYGCQAAFWYMKEQKKGAIANVSPLTAHHFSAGRNILYEPLKPVVNNLTNTFVGEYCVRNVRVTCIMPGFTVTPLVKRAISQEELDHNASSTLLRRMAEPEEIAKPIVFLTSDAASYMTAVMIEVSGERSMMLGPTYAYDRLETKQKAKQKAREKGGYLR